MEARRQTWQLPGTSTPVTKGAQLRQEREKWRVLLQAASEDPGMPRNKLGNLRVDISTNL